MIRTGIVWGVARAEARLCRRLVRYWIFVGLATGLALAAYGGYAFMHWQFSAHSATSAMLNPRYLIGILGFYSMTFFLVGLVFLGYEVRARDERERIVEVVDSLPCSNLELILGRYLGLLIPYWIPVVAIAAMLALVGSIAGAPVEPLSLVTFTVFQALPAFTVALGVVFTVSLLLRHRGLVAVGLLVAFVALMTVGMLSPAWLSALSDVTGAFTAPFPSDVVPIVIDGLGALQRLGMLLLGFGLLVLAAVVHPRRDDASRGKRLALALTIIVVAMALPATVVVRLRGMIDQHAAWRAAHQERRNTPAPDITELVAAVVVKPGHELILDVRTTLRAPVEGGLQSLLFTLNPGLEITELTHEDGSDASFSHENGLVVVDRTLPAGAETSLTWSIRGKPDPVFAYLDDPDHVLETQALDGNVFMLGYENAIYKKRLVALMPGIHWLPAGGSDIGRGDPRERTTDYYRLELDVEIPEGWLVAGPSRREPLGAGETGSRFRFVPPAPVPAPALIAGAYESRAAEIEGVQAELLFIPQHAARLEVFEDAVGELRSRVGSMLREAAAAGLPYPYNAITLVEVPTALRVYGGGWRRGSELGPPAMFLVRELTLPTARFERHFRDENAFRDREGGMPAAKVEMLEKFFENDFSGGNLFTAIARSFFNHQAAGSGDEGVPLDFVCEDLTSRVVSGRHGFFSAYLYDRDMGQYINEATGTFMASRGRRQIAFADALIGSVTSAASVWDEVLGVALAQIDPWEAPRKTINVLSLKGGAMARSMLDEFGRERTAAFLGALRERASGADYDHEDVLAAADAAGLALGDWLDLWLHQTDLPGFVVERVEHFRGQDAEDGVPRYVARFVLRNDEPAPGLLRIAHAVRTDKEGDFTESEPIVVDGPGAVEITLVSSEPLRWVTVDPYLSRNRTAFDIRLPELDEETITDESPMSGHRALPWKAPQEDTVVVDDLSEGFDIEDETGREMLRLGRQEEAEDTDQGLPVLAFGQSPKRWSRRTVSGAFGKYRHTYAIAPRGQGKRRAVFRAEVPRAGRWDLEFHLPHKVDGTYRFVVEDTSGLREEVELALTGSDAGWSAIGSYEIDAGEVRVVLSDETDARRVVADAVRWVPATRAPREG